MKRLLLSAGVLIGSAAACQCASSIGGPHPERAVTVKQRAAILRRAQAWTPTDVAAMDLRAGPQRKGAFAPGETITCDYIKEALSGNTPKFGCALASADRLKVRFGRANGEVYGAVAATRLLWALGFGADAIYPVHVICRGCPKALEVEGRAEPGQIRFDIATVERKMAGEEIEVPGTESGWSWDELDLVDEHAGGAPREQRDALKLLAVFLQHTDSKREQQRLLCLDPKSHRESGYCAAPFMIVHDVGQTFGSANIFNRNPIGSVNFEQWTHAAIWKDASRCIGNLTISQTGTLNDPRISRGGVTFLLNLLGQLTDDQLRGLFTVARFADRPAPAGNSPAPVEAWVDAFKHKREEIATAACQ